MTSIYWWMSCECVVCDVVNPFNFIGLTNYKSWFPGVNFDLKSGRLILNIKWYHSLLIMPDYWWWFSCLAEISIVASNFGCVLSSRCCDASHCLSYWGFSSNESVTMGFSVCLFVCQSLSFPICEIYDLVMSTVRSFVRNVKWPEGMKISWNFWQLKGKESVS